MLCAKIIDKNGKTAAVDTGEQEVNLSVTREYEEGDRICIEFSEKPCYVWLQVDDALGESLVYVQEDIQYVIPFGEKKVHLSPKAFSGNRHLIHVRRAHEFEKRGYRNLALNVNDQHENTMSFPHASANVETRGESVFAAQNAIDGVTANHSHGEWPYASWGINRDPNAKIRIDFGREVAVDRMVIYLRADFPHDNWWEQATAAFSDGTSLKLSFRKTDEGQEFIFDTKKICWLELFDLTASSEPSPFPALTQLEVYGTEAEEV